MKHGYESFTRWELENQQWLQAILWPTRSYHTIDGHNSALVLMIEAWNIREFVGDVHERVIDIVTH